MILRPPSLAEAPTVAALGQRAFADAFRQLYAPEDLAVFFAEWRSPERFQGYVENPDVGLMVAEDGDDLLGYCAIFFAQGFAERPEPRPVRPALLSQLYCAKDATGRGVGAALLDWALAEARDRANDAVQLSVWSENTRAQRFYARYGFEKVADIDFWVGNHRDDEFLYELRLD